MRRTRRAVAVACIALIVCAAFLPLGGLSPAWLVLTPVFTLLPPFPASVVCRQARPHRQQAAAVLASLDPRGPPASSSLP